MATDLAPKPLFLNLANTYDQDELRQLLADVVVEGVNGINDFLVVPKGGTAANPDGGGASRNQSVDILGLGAGPDAAAWITGDTTPLTDGIYRQRAGAVTINEALGANASGSTRIDLVILEVIPGSNKTNTRVVAGTPGSGVAPALPNNAIPLASVSCVNGFTVIAAAQITDLRTRAYRPVFEAFPGADVNGIGANAWTDICTLPNIVTKSDRTVQFEIQMKVLNTDGTNNANFAARIIDTAQGNAFVCGTGQRSCPISATGTGNNAAIDAAISKPVAAGSHTYKLQAFKGTNGTVNVLKSETLAAQLIACTRLAAIL